MPYALRVRPLGRRSGSQAGRARVQTGWKTTSLTLLSLFSCPALVAAAATGALQPYDIRTVVMDGLGEQACQKHLEKTETRLSGFVLSHQPYAGPYAPGRNCFLIFKAPPSYRIRLRVMEFGVGGGGEVGGSCKKDTLHVFDQDDSVLQNVDGPGPIIGQFCGVIPNGTVLATSTLNVLTLWWHTDAEVSSPPPPRTGFRLLWTAFRAERDGEEVKPCDKEREFRCSNGDCIPAQLACDSLPHCLDASDNKRQRQVSAGCWEGGLEGGGALVGGLSDAALGGLCFGSVLGSVLLCVGGLICCRDRCYRPAKTATPSSHYQYRDGVDGRADTSAQPSDTYLLPPPPPQHPSSSSTTYARIPSHGPPLLPPQPYGQRLTFPI